MRIDLSQLITADDKLAAAWDALRADRDARLRASDWAVLRDATPPLGREAWLTYRQALRDLPATTLDPAAPLWPNLPAHEDPHD